MGLAQRLISRLKSVASSVTAKLPLKNLNKPLVQNGIIIVLVSINALIFLAIPVLILLPNASDAREVEQITQVQRSQEVQTAPIPKITITEEPAEEPNAKSYEISGSSASRIGVDVADYQGVIDWPAVRANGIEFAIIKVGARGYLGGSLIPDGQYEANIVGARNAGLQIGVYFFSQAVDENEAIEEANFVLGKLGGIALDYPVVYDCESVSDSEGRINELSSEQRSKNARAFCDQIKAFGYTPMLYGNYKDMSHYDSALIAEYDIWFAHYNVYSPRQTSYPINIWQFTSNGRINGINARVDLNVHFDDDAPRQLPSNVVVHESPPESATEQQP